MAPLVRHDPGVASHHPPTASSPVGFWPHSCLHLRHFHSAMARSVRRFSGLSDPAFWIKDGTQQVTQLPLQNLNSMGKVWHGQSMHATWCVNAGALQGAGLCLQRSCTVMQLRERRLFSMQLVLRVCPAARTRRLRQDPGLPRPARNPAMPGGDARIQIKCDVENKNPRFDCFD